MSAVADGPSSSTPAAPPPAAIQSPLSAKNGESTADRVSSKIKVEATQVFADTSSSSSSSGDGNSSTLQVRKLSFGKGGGVGGSSSAAGSVVRPASTGPTPTIPMPELPVAGQQGLPSLLKKLRQDAQEEIVRATAHVRQIVTILTREIALAESDREAVCQCHEANLTALLDDVRMLEGQRAELVRNVHELEAAKASLESRNAALTAETAEAKEEAQRARERADAMEAASVFLQPAEVAGGGEQRHNASNSMDVTEDRVGSRSLHGTVSLANVPAMHGGSAIDTEYEDDELDPELAGIRVEGKVTGGGASFEVDTRGRCRSTSAASSASRTVFGRSKGQNAPANANGHSQSQETGAHSTAPDIAPNERSGKVTRKFSFTRKAGSKIVRSLSFGSEPKRPWEGRDAPIGMRSTM